MEIAKQTQNKRSPYDLRLQNPRTDAFERPFDSLDCNLSWTRPSGLSIGLNIQNILMQTRRLEQDRFPFQVIDPGLKAGVRVGYQFDL